MKAIVFTEYGSPDVLKLEEVEKPIPKENEVLVEVHAASVNSWDWDILRGTPFVNRLMAGIRKPKKIKILGCDIAGRVEAIGKNVDQLKPGDEVFGDISRCGWGGFAEYVCADENALALKPIGLTFEEAAAAPQAAVLALQGFRHQGQIQPGQKVLINGGGGGVGTFAVQIAKASGAEVTGVDSTNKLEMMLSIGADQVIDYTKEDYTRNGQQYDLILDNVAHRSISDYKRALNHQGTFVMVGGGSALVFQIMLLGPFISITSRKKFAMLLHKPDKRDLNLFAQLFEAGKVVPVIDKRYPLNETPEAIRYLGEGHVKGKVVIAMDRTNQTYSSEGKY